MVKTFKKLTKLLRRIAMLSKEEYLKKTGKTIEVIAPSGTVFTIQTIKGRQLAMEGNPAFFSSIDEANKNKIVPTMTKEQQKEQFKFMDKMICLAVADPKLSLEPIQEKLSIGDLSDEDYYCLVKAVTEFSIGGKDGQSSNFRKDKSPDNIRPDGKEVREVAKPNNE